MMEIFDVSYNKLSDKRSMELFSLRKKVFKDRLNWAVTCTDDMEFDEYDNKNTTYLFGVYGDTVICGLRFIEMKYNNMVTGTTFRSFFKKINVTEGNYLDASRLFIDKFRVRKLNLNLYPLSSMLFLAMINYAMNFFHDGIYAIISHPMLIIFKRSGWLIKVVEQGLSEKKENIYLIYMPVDKKNQQILINNINTWNNSINNFYNWPLSFPLWKKQA